MATFKGILKKISGGIKKATIFAPLVIGGLSIVSLLGDVISIGVVNDKIDRGFVETETYQTVVFEENKQLTEQYENGTISSEEYIESVNNFGTSNYVRDIIRRDIEGNEKWQGMLKTADSLIIATFSCFGALAISGLCCGLWFAGPNVADLLDDSADRDFEWRPPKKEEKKPEPVKEETKHDDISSDEQELGSLDEFLDSFTERS